MTRDVAAAARHEINAKADSLLKGWERLTEAILSGNNHSGWGVTQEKPQIPRLYAVFHLNLSVEIGPSLSPYDVWVVPVPANISYGKVLSVTLNKLSNHQLVIAADICPTRADKSVKFTGGFEGRDTTRAYRALALVMGSLYQQMPL